MIFKVEQSFLALITMDLQAIRRIETIDQSEN